MKRLCFTGTILFYVLTLQLNATATTDIVTPLNSGTSGPFVAVPDYIDDHSITITNVSAVNVALTDNDGIVLKDATGVNNILLTSQYATDGTAFDKWHDIGPLQNAEATLHFEEGALVRSVSSVYPGITRAVICNGSEISELFYQGMRSAGNILPDNADKKSASIEFWVRPDASTFNSQISTLYETGGGTGCGIVIDHGVLQAAVAIKTALVQYDLNADVLNVLPYDPTNEFFQVVFVMDLDADKNQLYVNGTLVAESGGNTITDWDGGDDAGVGRFQGTNHGGFAANAANTAYNTYYAGAIYAINFYGAALSATQIQQNFAAITVPSASAPSSLAVAGIYNASDLLISGLGNPVTLDSGAVVTLDSITGNFTYDPSGLSDTENLWKGCYFTDSFICQVTNSNGDASNSRVTLKVYGASQNNQATVEVREGVNNTITASQLLAADQLDHGALNPFLAFYANPAFIREPYNTQGVWLNAGSSGNDFDASSDTICLKSVISKFGGISYAAYQPQGATQPPAFVANDDMTIEIWFKPDYKAFGQQVLYEIGGSGQGSALVYNAEKNSVEAYIDGGNDGDSSLQLFAEIGGVSWNEFNQLIAVFDINNDGSPDTITLYLNNTPQNSFNSAQKVTASNPAGAIKLMSGTASAGIGTIAGSTMALSKTFNNFSGAMAHLRVYDKALNTTQMAEAYESIRRPLISVTQTLSSLGATVALNPDGTLAYDASTLTTNIPYGAIATDTVHFQIQEADNSTVDRTAQISIRGADSTLVNDDYISVAQGAGAFTFNPLANDTHTAAVIQQDAIVIADFRDDFTAGSTIGEIGDFRDGNGYGWSYMWNAPTGWVDTLPYDGNSGEITDTNAYQFLVWDGSFWAVNSDGIAGTGEPGDWVRLTSSSGSHPGSGVTDLAGRSPVQRRPIAIYTVSQPGYYGITQSSLRKSSTIANPIHVAVLTDDQIKISKIAPNAETINFDGELGYLDAGSRIAVGVGAYLSRGNDGFNIDFTIVKLPSADSKVPRYFGSLTTDGATMTFTPTWDYNKLGPGQSYFETLTYTVMDNGVPATATISIEITGVNDAPTGVYDSLTNSEDIVTSNFNVLTNDTDIDKGDTFALTVAAVNGSVANVDTPFITALGATATFNSDGTFSYDTTDIADLLNTLSHNDTLSESFSYLVHDPHGLAAAKSTLVTINISGSNDNVTAAPKDYVIRPNQIITGNLLTDDTGNGRDADPDANDTLSILSVNTDGLIGDLQFEQREISRIVGFRGRTTINGNSKTVTFDPVGGTLSNPVIFTSPASLNEPEPGSIKITRINALQGTFDIEFKEQREDGIAYDGDGNAHADEDISWMVFDAGQYYLSDGTRFEVGKTTLDAYRQRTGASKWQSVQLATDFTGEVIVINQLQHWVDPFNELFTTRMQSLHPHTYDSVVQSNTFNVALECIEADQNDSTGAFCTIGWIAIEAGTGLWDGYPYQAGFSANSFDQNGSINNFAVNFGTAPDMIASLVTYAGSDPSSMRYEWISGTQYKFFTSEEQTLDTEVSHASEIATFLAIGGDATELYAYDLTPPAGSFIYDPTGNTGLGVGGTSIETFTYVVTDGKGSTDTGTVTISIVPPAGTTFLLR